MATTFSVTLKGVYGSTDKPEEIMRATGFSFSVNSGPIKTSVDLGFDEGLELLRQMTEQAARYRNAVQAQLDVTAKLASAEALVASLPRRRSKEQ